MKKAPLFLLSIILIAFLIGSTFFSFLLYKSYEEVKVKQYIEKTFSLPHERVDFISSELLKRFKVIYFKGEIKGAVHFFDTKICDYVLKGFLIFDNEYQLINYSILYFQHHSFFKALFNGKNFHKQILSSLKAPFLVINEKKIKERLLLPQENLTQKCPIVLNLVNFLREITFIDQGKLKYLDSLK
jgi:hypothetical protein